MGVKKDGGKPRPYSGGGSKRRDPSWMLVSACLMTCLFVFSPLHVRCQTTLDLCSGTTDCQNNGTCVNRGYDTICNCSGTNYTGWYCNVTVNQGCSDNLCLNGGTCTSDLNSSFTCICPRGYEGPLCERLIDYCHKDGYMCAYNGTCTNIPGSYICTCDNSTGYGGVNCTDRVTNCPQGSCSNGQCFYGSNNYTCVCNNGYEGLTCSSVYDVCVNQSSCQRGMCSVSGCNCTGTGFTGPGCDVMVDECKNSTSACKHGGNCTDVEFGFSCNCSLGYRGDTCEIPDCSLTECYNNGTCKTNATEWSCDCPKFVEGGQCESVGPCYYQPCSQTNSNNCTQQIQNNTYQCHCKPGWTGKNCTEDIDECTARELNCVHGQCVNTPGSAYCNCTPGYKDKFCDVDINECQSNPCQHGGTCVDGVNNYTCQCGHSGFDGPNCADDIDECALNASICNHGNCTNEIGNFSCVCDKEYLAPDCLHLDPCFNFTCLNGGTCTINESNMAVCACSGSFQGVTCEKSPSSAKDTDLGVIIGPIIGGIVFVIIVIVVIAFIMTARSKRATRGAYSPSQQETSGSRVELGNVLKKPPEERLI